TRFNGLGEISPSEFGLFIGKEMRLDPVILTKDNKLEQLLQYYMGKNKQDRQKHIIENLRIEIEIEEEIKKEKRLEEETVKKKKRIKKRVKKRKKDSRSYCINKKLLKKVNLPF